MITIKDEIEVKMSFNEKINLFELTDKIVNRFREESGFKLSGYEFGFKFNRDWNCPLNRIHFNFFIFNEDYAHTVFDEKYDTVDKVIELLFCHLKDDMGISDLKDGLIMIKRNSLEERLDNLTEKIKLISKELIESNNKSPLIVGVDEKYPYTETYENGFPIFQYQISNNEKEIDINIDLDFNLQGFDEESVIIRLRNEIKEKLHII